MSELENIIQKIQKLFALAERAGTEAEAETANRLAFELLAKYNLEMSSVIINDDPISKIEAAEFLERYREQWRIKLMGASAELYFCKYFYKSSYIEGAKSGRDQAATKHCFTGQKHNIAVASMTGMYLISTVNRLANNAVTAAGYTGTARARFVKSFRHACSERVAQRIRELKQKSMFTPHTTSDGTNLPAMKNMYDQEEALINEFLARAGIKVTYVARKPTVHYKQGLDAGTAAAETISLNTQISATKENNVMMIEG